MSATNISNLLLQNINELLTVEIQLDKALTRREIDLRVRKCGKLKGKSISKTLTKGRLLNTSVFFQGIAYTLHLTCCIFMSMLNAKQV